METSVVRTDSQRSQSSGPRVSFNRDVHVKRIGLRPNEQLQSYPAHVTNQHQQQQQLRRELPKDLTKEAILKEAALVISQAERVKCTAKGDNEIVGGRVNVKSRGPIIRKIENIPGNFSSLPTRKKKPKPVTRSSSDASNKKPKKSFLFDIFSRKSDTNLNQIDNKENKSKTIITRSKSELGDLKGFKNRKSLEPDYNNLNKKAQLSPIIENSPKEDFFKTNPPTKTKFYKKNDQIDNHFPSGNIGYTNQKDLDLIPSKPTISESLKEAIIPIVNSLNSSNGVHSSQLPPEKPRLTKGITVDNMVKRLSMERLSPAPQLNSQAFSYTRPNDHIVYAHVVYDNDGRSKQTVRSNFVAKNNEGISSQTNGFDTVDGVTKTVSSSQPNLYKHMEKRERSFSPTTEQFKSKNDGHSSTLYKRYNSLKNNSDEDEGLGSESRKELERIIPVSRNVMSSTPERYHQNNGHYRGKADGSEHCEINGLSNRRKQLESRMFMRKIGSIDRNQLKDGMSPERYSRSVSRETVTPERLNKTESSLYHHDKYLPEKTQLRLKSPQRDEFPENFHKITTITKEYHSRKRSTSPKEIDLGYIEDCNNFYQNSYTLDPNTSYYQEKYRQEFEPKSLETPVFEPIKSVPPPEPPKRMNRFRHNHNYIADPNNGHNLLKRDNKQQRSFDKGDSGIENDYRKDSFPGHEKYNFRFHRRTTFDDIEDTDLFLKRERLHSAQLYQKRYNYKFRERSIDDGSHFDPRLDKYSYKYSSPRNLERTDIKVGTKKLGGFEKMKQLFTGSSKKKAEIKREESMKYQTPMARDHEVRSRYTEHKGNTKISDITTRRRLSTPRASPLPKRTPSQKSYKSSSTSIQTELPAKKMGWFKSLDRLSRKKSSNSNKSEDEVSAIRPIPRQPMIARNVVSTQPGKNLRFFGDTDVESNATYSRTWKDKFKQQTSSSAALTKNRNYSQSAYDLNATSKKSEPVGSSYRSTSMHNLENDSDVKPKYTNRYLHRSSTPKHDISESASDNDTDRNRRDATPERTIPYHSYDNRYNDNSLKRVRDRERSRSAAASQAKTENRKPPTAPPQKPARNVDRRKTFSRERDRVFDSSGTEGESSQQSQRSIVYLHATTVGDIPQPFARTARRAVSREELSSNRSKQLQPMTKTVSRSVSMLAPWKPKHMHSGYEINYAQGNDKLPKPLAKVKKERSSTLTRNRKQSSRDDVSSLRNSSIINHSTSTLPKRTNEWDNKNERYFTTNNRYELKSTPPPPPPPPVPTARRRWNV